MEEDKEKAVLRKFQELVSIGKPATIKKVTAFLDYQEGDGNRRDLLFVTIVVRIETDYFYAEIPWLGDCSSFKTQEEKEVIQKEMTEYLIEVLEGDLETDYPKNYWKGRDLRQEKWKRKEE